MPYLPYERRRDEGCAERDRRAHVQRVVVAADELLGIARIADADGDLRRDDGAHYRDAERPADLPHAVDDRRSDAGLGNRNGPHRRGGRRRHRERHSAAAGEEAGEDRPEGRSGVELREQEQRGRDEQHPGSHQPPRANPVRESPRPGRDRRAEAAQVIGGRRP